MVGYEEFNFTKANHFLNALRSSDDRWLEKGLWECHWIFRGHANASWPLIPSAWRDSTRENDRVWSMAEQYVGSSERVLEKLSRLKTYPPEEQASERLVYVARQQHYEFLNLRAFALMVNELGLRVPGPPFDELKISEIYDKMQAPDLRPIHPVAALAQHHGIPTRLLDWTTKPLVAAYFASSEAKLVGDTNAKQVCVWALNTLSLNSDIHVLRYPRSDFGFLHAQSGLFTYLRDADKLWLQKGDWPSLEELAPQPSIRKLTLPYSEAPELERLLWAEGISKAHLMPTLDNVKSALKQALDRKTWLERNVAE